MNIRPTQNTNFALVRNGLAINLSKLITAQEQVSTGKKLLRPSDDPVGASSILGLKRQVGGVKGYLESINTSRPMLEAGMASLNEAGTILAEARSLGIAGLNGTTSEADRTSLASELRLLKERLLEMGNAKLGDRYLFGGTASTTQPFQEREIGGQLRVFYEGNEESRQVEVGSGVVLPINMPGSEVFGRFEVDSVSLGSLTGLSLGVTANQGSGYGYVHVRHDATLGAPGSGVTLANGGANDTLVGDRALIIDAAAGTVQLGTGTALAIPAASNPNLANFAVTDENGAVVYLDFSNFNGTSSVTTLTGEASISLDQANWQTLDLTQTDLELTDPATGTILHLDTRRVVRATSELYSFDGGVNAFDVLEGMIEDLENIHGLAGPELQARLSSRLQELDRNFENVQSAQGTLGSRSQRLDSGANRLSEFQVTLQGLISDREDADLASVILDMTRAEQTLQVAQASGTRLLQTTLLDYLR